MTNYQQNTNSPDALTGNMDALLSSLTPGNIVSAQPFFAALQITMAGGAVIDAFGTGLGITLGSGAPVFSGTVTRLVFYTAGASRPSLTLEMPSAIPLATVFGPGQACFPATISSLPGSGPMRFTAMAATTS